MKNTVQKIESIALPGEGQARMVVMVGLFILALLVASYVYFVGKIVFDVVARRTAEASIRSKETAVSGLTISYFQKLRGMDMSSALALGLSESHSVLYASRTAESGKTVGFAR